MRILALEDNPSDLHLLKRALRDQLGPEHEVLHAERLAAAIEQISAAPADVVLADLDLPDSHGIETIRAVKEAAPDAAVIALTGSDPGVLAYRALELGAQDYIAKADVLTPLLGRAIRYALHRQGVQNQLDEAHRRIELANAEMQEFTYAASHDLKSPLLTIQGYCELLHAACEARDRDSIHDALAVIQRTCRNATAMIDDLLILSRVGRSEWHPEPVDLSELVHEMRVSLQPRAAQRGVAIVADEDLPAVETDRASLRRVLENLMTNALKYGCPQAGSTLRIGATQRGDRVEIFVQDNGPGIPEADRERAFKVFQRLSDEPGGTGVGLCVCRRIVERASGEIWIDDTPGGGATFRFTMPAAIGDARREAADPAATAA
ncbi:MAG: hybrid sensor histidine kinase/response regulator [Planctomycetota bacterium]